MKLSSLSSIKFGKTTMALCIALLIGLLAAWGARSYLAQRVEALEAKSQGKTVQVIVAKTDLGKGAKLSSSTLALRAVPIEFAHSSALKPEDFQAIDGQTLAFGAKSGEIIFWGLIEGKKVPTFSARVEPGRRAITVPVDEINSISGMLEPGDLIDLMLTIDQNGKKATIALLQSVQIMATGQRSVDDPKSGERRSYTTVTLNTAVQDAQKVIVARESGRLTALLRNPADKTPIQHAPGGAFNQQIMPTDTGLTREIPVLYGGRGGKLDPKALNTNAPSEVDTAENSLNTKPPVR